eukprot:Rmarinus@m.12888
MGEPPVKFQPLVQAGDYGKDIEDESDKDMEIAASISTAAEEVLLHRRHERYVQKAIDLTYFSMMVSTICAFTGIVLAIASNSAVTLAYAAENIIDCVSSFAVLWRFSGDIEDCIVNPDVSKYRERVGSVILALCFVFLSLLTGGTAISHLVRHDDPVDLGALYTVGAVSGVLLFVNGSLKVKLADLLSSTVLRRDGYCSLAGAVLAFGIVFGAGMYDRNEANWWVDSTIAIVVSSALLSNAIYILFVDPAKDEYALFDLWRDFSSWLLGHRSHKKVSVSDSL